MQNHCDRWQIRSTATAAALWKPDTFGHVWHIATHIEGIPVKELKKRAAPLAAAAEKG